MMVKPTVQELLTKAKNRYELVNVIAKRARQLASGDEPRVKTKELSKVTVASLELEVDELKKVEDSISNA